MRRDHSRQQFFGELDQFGSDLCSVGFASSAHDAPMVDRNQTRNHPFEPASSNKAAYGPSSRTNGPDHGHPSRQAANGPRVIKLPAQLDRVHRLTSRTHARRRTLGIPCDQIRTIGTSRLPLLQTVEDEQCLRLQTRLGLVAVETRLLLNGRRRSLCSVLERYAHQDRIPLH